MRYIIGIDIGTSNTKAVVYTEKGEVLETAEASYPAFTDAQGMHELEVAVLFDAVITVLLQVTEQRPPEEASAVCLSCAMHSLILVDEKGKPLTRAITWADRRSESSASTLRNSEAGRRIYRQTRVPIHAMSPLCKLLWLKDSRSDLFQRASRFISIKEYIWWRFFGKYQVDMSIASATGLLDIGSLDWNAESLELAGIHRGQLSELVSCTHNESALLPPWRSLGFATGMPFVIGGSDGCLANLGTGAVHPGETAVTIGTSGAVRMAVSQRPEKDTRERLFSYILTNDIYICGGATNNGGNAVQWYADLVIGKGRWDLAALDRLVADAEAVAPGCDGLVFLPYLLGERAPVWDAGAKGVFFGIRSIHDQRHFMRAILEGIAYSLRQIGGLLEETIGPIAQIQASGGFTRSPFWLQLIADVFLKKVQVTSGADASAIGAAMLGWHALGVFASLEDAAALVRTEAVYEPDANRHVAYEANYLVFIQLYDRLKDLM